MKISRLVLSFCALASCALARAEVISIDFHGGRNNNPASGSSVLPADAAGVTYWSVGNWNTVPNVTGAPNPFPDLASSPAPVGGLRNNFGTATTAAVSWSSAGAWDTNITANSGITRMMRGYLDTTDTSVSTVNVTGVPYGTYDVIVYFDGDNGGTSRSALYGVNSSGGFSSAIVGRDPASTNGTTLTQSFNVTDPIFALNPASDPAAAFTAAHNTAAAGNYVVFRGVTGSDFSLEAVATSSSGGIPPAGGLRAPINGIQITESVPHPIFFAPNGSGGYNAYEVRRDQASQAAAMNLADTMAFPGSSIYGVPASASQGHLASIQNATENESVRRHLLGNSWIGLTDSTTYGGLDTPATTNNQAAAPLPATGVAPIAGQKGFGWVWSRGRTDEGNVPTEPLLYQNWNGGEPNDSGANLGEDAVEMLFATGLWNDNRNGEGSVSNLHQTRDWVVEYDLNLAAPPTAANLPTPGPTSAGTFKVTTVRGFNGGTGQILHSQQADAFVRSGAGTTTHSDVPVINLADPQSANVGRFPGNITFDQNTAADDNDFVVVAKTKVVIPTAGLYTFGVDSDDGFRLRIPGQTFTSSSVISPTNGTYVQGDTMEMPWPRGGEYALSLGVINLPAGEHEVELMFFERAGGGGVELMAAPGAQTTFFNGSPGTRETSFRLVGYDGAGTATQVRAPGEIVGGQFAIKEVRSTTALNNLTDAANALANPALPTFTYNAPFVNLIDPDNTTVTGHFQGDVRFAADLAGDTNDIAVQATGILRITTPGDYTFGFRGDDGGQIEFLDPDGAGPLTTPAFSGFTRLGDQTAAHIVGIDGGKLFYNTNTGNSNLIGRINLAAGDYPIAATYWERSSGAFYEVFGAFGSKTAFDEDFMLLGASGYMRVDSDGLAIVPEPSTYMLALLGLVTLGAIRRRKK